MARDHTRNHTSSTDATRRRHRPGTPRQAAGSSSGGLPGQRDPDGAAPPEGLATGAREGAGVRPLRHDQGGCCGLKLGNIPNEVSAISSGTFLSEMPQWGWRPGCLEPALGGWCRRPCASGRCGGARSGAPLFLAGTKGLRHGAFRRDRCLSRKRGDVRARRARRRRGGEAGERAGGTHGVHPRAAVRGDGGGAGGRSTSSCRRAGCCGTSG